MTHIVEITNILPRTIEKARHKEEQRHVESVDHLAENKAEIRMSHHHQEYADATGDVKTLDPIVLSLCCQVCCRLIKHLNGLQSLYFS